MTNAKVISLILRCPTKSSPLDPIPTYVLNNLVDVPVAPITKIVNLFLSSGVFPDAMKLALVTPLLKKPNIDPEIRNMAVQSKSFCHWRLVIRKSIVFHLFEVSESQLTLI